MKWQKKKKANNNSSYILLVKTFCKQQKRKVSKDFQMNWKKNIESSVGTRTRAQYQNTYNKFIADYLHFSLLLCLLNSQQDKGLPKRLTPEEFSVLLGICHIVLFVGSHLSHEIYGLFPCFSPFVWHFSRKRTGQAIAYLFTLLIIGIWSEILFAARVPSSNRMKNDLFSHPSSYGFYFQLPSKTIRNSFGQYVIICVTNFSIEKDVKKDTLMGLSSQWLRVRIGLEFEFWLVDFR